MVVQLQCLCMLLILRQELTQGFRLGHKCRIREWPGTVKGCMQPWALPNWPLSFALQDSTEILQTKETSLRLIENQVPLTPLET